MTRNSGLEGLLRTVKGGVELEVHVKPRSRQTSLVLEGGCLTFYTEEPPLRGRANASLVKHLSMLLGVPRSRVLIVSGLTGRVKRVRIEAPRETVLERLGMVVGNG